MARHADETPVSSLLDPRTPYSYYKRLRADGHLVWDEAISSWIAPTYEGVRQVYRDDVSFRRPSPTELGKDRYVEIFGRRRLSALSREDRSRVRRWWLKIFAPSAAERWRTALVAPIVDAAIDQFAPNGRTEIYEDFAKPLSLQVIAAIMDLPYHDDSWLAKCRPAIDYTQAFIDGSRFGYDEAVAELALSATETLNGLLEPFVEARRDGTGDDVISMMWRDGPDLLPNWDIDDVYTTARNMFLTGSDTTKISLTNALHTALNNSVLADRVRRGSDEVVAAFVEESLRLHGTIHFRSRIATQDTEICGHAVRAGERVFAVNASASRDDGHYSSAQNFDLDREAPRDHLAFASGPASCFGAALARVELQEGVARFLRRLPDVHLDPTQEPPTFTGVMMRVHHPLNVAFTPEG